MIRTFIDMVLFGAYNKLIKMHWTLYRREAETPGKIALITLIIFQYDPNIPN